MADEKYVVHGMRAKCSEGSMENYINTDTGHGVVYQGQPVLNANDHAKDVNLTHFGDCKSKLIFEEAKKQADEKYKAEEGDGFFAKVGKTVAKTVTKAMLDVKATFASNKCELETPLPWIFTSRDHMIDGAPALTMGSQCACKFGGIITIVPQEEEAEDSNSKAPEISANATPVLAAGQTDPNMVGTAAQITLTVASRIASVPGITEVNSLESGMEDEYDPEKYIKLEQLDAFQFYMGKDVAEKEKNLDTLNRILVKYDIQTNEAKAYFLGQVAKESRKGSRTLEGYKGDDPEAYFNNKYDLLHAKRTGTGNLGGDDGELFRGAGYIQLTGRANYEKFAAEIGDDRILKEGYKIVGGVYNQDPDTIKYDDVGVIDLGEYAWEAAGWFWKYGNPSGKNLSEYAEKGDWQSISNAINKYDSSTFYERNKYINEFYNILTGEDLNLPEK